MSYRAVPRHCRSTEPDVCRTSIFPMGARAPAHPPPPPQKLPACQFHRLIKCVMCGAGQQPGTAGAGSRPGGSAAAPGHCHGQAAGGGQAPHGGQPQAGNHPQDSSTGHTEGRQAAPKPLSCRSRAHCYQKVTTLHFLCPLLPPPPLPSPPKPPSQPPLLACHITGLRQI